MNKTNGDEPINPTEITYNDGIPKNNYQSGNFTEHVGGLTKREYFAAMAMQGLRANPDLMLPADAAAIQACNDADALIKELNKWL